MTTHNVLKFTMALGAGLGLVFTASSLASARHSASSNSPTTAVDLRFERSDVHGLRIEHVETHSLELERLALVRGDGDPLESPASMHLWSGARSEAQEEVDPRSGLLRREYSKVEGTIQMGDLSGDQEIRSPEMALSSPLGSVGVAFTPVQDAPGGYGRHYDTVKTLSEGLLPRMAAPRDWGRILPRTPEGQPRIIAEDEVWEVAAQDFELLLAPLGNLALRGDDKTDPRILRAYMAGLGGNLHLGFGGEVGGTASARLLESGVSDEQGRYVEFQIDFALDLSADRSEFAERRRIQDGSEAAMKVLGARVDLVLEGRSKVLWSLDRNEPIRFATEADQSVHAKVSLTSASGEVVQQILVMSGDLRVASRFTDGALLGSARKQ